MTYVAIEGVIGVGKTTLARLIQPELRAQLVLEVFEENPFLSSFYADRARYAFQTQMFFLLSRYHQQRSLKMMARPLVSDYIFAKDALFARLNLSGDELEMYERVHAALAERVDLPDLIVFLRAETDVLMQRIALRDRPYERGMDRGYIDSLRGAYDAFFAGYSAAPVLTIDASGYDFVASEADRQEIITRVLGALGRAPHQEALPGFAVTSGGKITPVAHPPQEAAVPTAAPPAIGDGARRLRDYQQFHRWLDDSKGFSTDLFLNFILLQEEIGELAHLITKQYRTDRSAPDSPPLTEIGAELADVLAYVLKLANYLGVDLEAAYLDKMQVNVGRQWR